jgi:hypothetical protein
MACRGDEISNLCSPSGGHAREIEEGGDLGGGRRTKEVEEALVAFSFMGNCDEAPTLGVPLYSGEGYTLPLLQGNREAAKGEARAAAASARAGRPSSNPNPSLARLRAHGAQAQ